LKTITNATDSETRGQKDEEEKKKEEAKNLEMLKGANTSISVRIFVPGEQHPRVKGEVNVIDYIRSDVGKHPSGTKYEAFISSPSDPKQPTFSLSEVNAKIQKKLAEAKQ
jgi:hypothetical protein